MKPDFLSEFEFFAGVPDSRLKALCDWLMDRFGISKNHIVAANEGNAAALAAGWYLATGKTPVVYMQNSGIGNAVNPIASLMNDKVYAIPCLFIIGWRGEPGVHDEPQHLFQGEITLKLLEDMGMDTFVIDRDTTEAEIMRKLGEFKGLFAQGRQAAFVVRKGALEYEGQTVYANRYAMSREEVIRRLLDRCGDDAVVSTTGKASRELFELREQRGEGHERDFLTVGSMGHSLSAALGIALQKPGLRVWVIDGDGAALMHMGGMALVGANAPANLIHIIINNTAHETVGGIPTAAGSVDFLKIAEGCGYPRRSRADTFEELDRALADACVGKGPALIEARCAIGARKDLGRPTLAPGENKDHFMEFLNGRQTAVPIVRQEAEHV